MMASSAVSAGRLLPFAGNGVPNSSYSTNTPNKISINICRNSMKDGNHSFSVDVNKDILILSLASASYFYMSKRVRQVENACSDSVRA